MNFLANGRATQPTSFAMLTTVADIFTNDLVRQSTPQSAVILTTPPTFTGILTATPTVDGPILITWGAFTSINLPVEFQVYVALGVVSAATLFALEPVAILPQSATSYGVFMLTDQVTYLVRGQIYTLGVRCKDAVKNQNNNLAILTSTAIGTVNLPTVLQNLEINLAQDHVNFQSDHTDFQADHTDFQADHADFVADHADFQADHADLQADHADFQQDHTNFVADDAAFDADHVIFQADHADFQQDHANFVADDAAEDTNTTSLQISVTALEEIVTNLEASANSISSSQLHGEVTVEGEVVSHGEVTVEGEVVGGT